MAIAVRPAVHALPAVIGAALTDHAAKMDGSVVVCETKIESVWSIESKERDVATGRGPRPFVLLRATRGRATSDGKRVRQTPSLVSIIVICATTAQKGRREIFASREKVRVS